MLGAFPLLAAAVKAPFIGMAMGFELTRKITLPASMVLIVIGTTSVSTLSDLRSSYSARLFTRGGGEDASPEVKLKVHGCWYRSPAE